MANDTAKTQTVNFLPVQGTFEPLPPYDIITFIGPAGEPFYAPVNPVLDGVSITNSTINSTTIGATTPSTAAFTTATMSNQPASDTDLCNKLYVDTVALGIAWKQPVLTATSGPITLSGAQTVDTVPVVTGDRVLVKNQSSAYQNGIYIVGTPWTRSPDANSWDELISAMVFVEEGSSWICLVLLCTTGWNAWGDCGQLVKLFPDRRLQRRNRTNSSSKHVQYYQHRGLSGDLRLCDNHASDCGQRSGSDYIRN